MTSGPHAVDESGSAGEPRGSHAEATPEASERLKTCARASCETEFEPYRSNQKYCSENCRKRAWEERRRRRMAKHVARELLDPERIEAAIASFENEE